MIKLNSFGAVIEMILVISLLCAICVVYGAPLPESPFPTDFQRSEVANQTQPFNLLSIFNTPSPSTPRSTYFPPDFQRSEATNTLFSSAPRSTYSPPDSSSMKNSPEVNTPAADRVSSTPSMIHLPSIPGKDDPNSKPSQNPNTNPSSNSNPYQNPNPNPNPIEKTEVNNRFIVFVLVK